ncbi:hypothetical protein NDU88_007916 [Pleurodeles waltl]|uniref:Uncharacterized protein n=1 Tax=Pleurodeles waltl TaxID=8319 RepID=A0AAV7STU9_PLEWA|nr:hypothetical protein NDU88_007916 [Pleurodeles waltl]
MAISVSTLNVRCVKDQVRRVGSLRFLAARNRDICSLQECSILYDQSYSPLKLRDASRAAAQEKKSEFRRLQSRLQRLCDLELRGWDMDDDLEKTRKGHKKTSKTVRPCLDSHLGGLREPV